MILEKQRSWMRKQIQKIYDHEEEFLHILKEQNNLPQDTDLNVEIITLSGSAIFAFCTEGSKEVCYPVLWTSLTDKMLLKG